MELDKLNPFIRYANLHRCYVPPKTNNVCYDCRLFYVLEGEGGITVNGVEYAVEPSTAVYLPPESRYRFCFRDPEAVKIYVLDFDLVDDYCEIGNSLRTATEEDFSYEKVPRYPIPTPFLCAYVIANAIDIHGYIARSVEMILERGPYFREGASASIKLALLSMLTGASRTSGDARLVDDITSYIRENYRSAGLTNKLIAEHLHYHPYYLGRVMKASLGMTLREYIEGYRIEMAKNYLITTSHRITEIAEKCGFASYTHFIKVFRERIGISPLRYRRSHQMMGL